MVLHKKTTEQTYMQNNNDLEWSQWSRQQNFAAAVAIPHQKRSFLINQLNNHCTSPLKINAMRETFNVFISYILDISVKEQWYGIIVYFVDTMRLWSSIKPFCISRDTQTIRFFVAWPHTLFVCSNRTYPN